MHILLDECVHAGVRAAFDRHFHAVRTVTESGWRGSKDGPLLGWAQAEFEVFVTVDRNIVYQQDLKKFKMGFVVVRVRNNEIASDRPLFDELLHAAETVATGEVMYVSATSPRESSY